MTVLEEILRAVVLWAALVSTMIDSLEMLSVFITKRKTEFFPWRTPACWALFAWTMGWLSP